MTYTQTIFIKFNDEEKQQLLTIERSRPFSLIIDEQKQI